jgi:hypothetical protein
MGRIKENSGKHFTIQPDGQALDTMADLSPGPYASLGAALSEIETHTRGVCRLECGSTARISAELMRPTGSVSSIEAPGMLPPKEPANRAAPQAVKGRKLLKSSGQTKQIRTSHCFLQEAVTPPDDPPPLSNRPMALAGWLTRGT